MPGFQEAAAVSLRDPSSLISSNSPLKAESSRRQKYFFRTEYVVMITSSQFFGANKKLLIGKQLKMLAVL